MAAPPKDLKKTDVKKEDEAPLQAAVETLSGKDIKQVFRAISTTSQYMEGFDVQPVDVVNDYIRSIMEQGYDLFYVSHVRTVTTVDDIPIGEQMLYILVRQ
jgi:hypothetical protein